ncbi:hypothetical protein D3C72_1785190 [compost metagenome]
MGSIGRGPLFSFTLTAFALFALTAFFHQFFLLLANQLHLMASCLFTPNQLVGFAFSAGLLFADLCFAFGTGFAAFVTLYESALLAHFHLNGAGPAGGISLLDFARRLFRQCDFLAVSSACAMAGLQVREQFLFIGLGQRI